MRGGGVLGCAAIVTMAVSVSMSCGAPQPDTAGEAAESPATALVASPEARSRIDAVRTRFRIAPPARPRGPELGSEPPPAPIAVLGPSVATGFERAEGERIRPAIPAAAKRSVLRSASVELPARAGGPVHLEADTPHGASAFTLEGATGAPVEVAEGIARYPGGWRGADVIHRADAEGTEDFIVLEEKPAREELRYHVDVERVAGLRLVSNVLELLDEGGAPRLRMRSPYVIDAAGTRTDARIEVAGCAYDTDPSGPWGRPVTRAGAAQCEVRVGWEGVKYPAIVDPAWVTTGSMVAARRGHTMTPLGGGTILLAGGVDTTVGSAELFDGTSSFAVTGPMIAARKSHSATLLGSGKVLLAGGRVMGTLVASAELFDAAGTFTSTPPMVSKRANHTATLLKSGKVLVAGGDGTSFNPVNSAELFDANGTGAFAATGNMFTARSSHTATLLPSGKVLLAGGFGAATQNPPVATAELFDGLGAFAATGSMVGSRGAHTATLLGSGKVLVTGGTGIPGFSNVRPVASAELFDGVAAFAAVMPMASARSAHTATLLAGDRVLVTGGNDLAGGSTVATAEVFDGSAGFAATASMANARASHTAMLLSSGSVLVAGGGNLAVSELASAEIYELKANGASCAIAADCVSFHCADGVCCDSACGNPCDVCSAAAGGLVDGTCATAPLGTQTATCGGIQACNGVDQTCPSGCVLDGDCALGYYCAKGGACTPRKAQAATCDAKATGDCKVDGCRVCSTGHCVDGFCCDSACGPCGNCALPTAGTCAAKPLDQPSNPAGACGLELCDGVSPACPTTCATTSDCIPNYFCKAGQCMPQHGLGVACTGAETCVSGFCVDGVCCASACGQCQACNLPASKGTCAAFSGDPTTMGHPACPGDKDCGGTCDGADPGCHFPGAGTPCGSKSTCTGDVATAAQQCDGSGTCAPAATMNCPPYACDSTSGACKQSCATSADCAQGAACDTSTGKCATAAGTCEDAFTAKSPDGQLVPCSPYRCKNGACQATCASDADCADGSSCKGSKCEPSSGAGGTSGGTGAGGSATASGSCGFRTSPEGSSRASLVLLMLVPIAGRRMRRSRRDTRLLRR